MPCFLHSRTDAGLHARCNRVGDHLLKCGIEEGSGGSRSASCSVGLGSLSRSELGLQIRAHTLTCLLARSKRLICCLHTS